MKNHPTFHRICLLLAVLVCVPATVHAQFTFATNNGAITITGYTGSGGGVAIPGATNGYPVTSIGVNAFENKSVTSVTIPNSVTNLADRAFYGCVNLTNVTIPESVISVGQEVFSGCQTLNSVTIANGVASVGAIPSGLAGIGTSMFDQCGLTSMTIPNSVTSIAPAAFASSALTNVVISANVTSLGAGAFNLCYGLRSVYFLGNAPGVDGSLFAGNATVYYLPFTTGWSNNFAGATTMLWTPPLPALGVATYSNQPVMYFPYLASTIGTHYQLQMTTNLTSGNWVPVTNGVTFICVQITNAPSPAFFRLQ